MGLETAFVSMGMSATTASAVATGIYTAAAGAVVSAATAPKMPKDNSVAPLASTDRPPGVQAEKAVDRGQLLDQNAMAASAAGAASGNAGTWLTGPTGARNGQNLGTSTLLGQ